MKKLGIFLAALIVFSLVAGWFLVKPLKLPFEVPVVAYDAQYAGAMYKCKEFPAPVKDLSYHSVYDDTDESRSIIDDKAYKAYKAAVEPIAKYETQLAKLSNSYINSRGMDRSASYCALKAMKYWADNDALLGSANSQGEAVRKWTLGTLATSYAQISSDPYLDKHEKKAVKHWLGQIAGRVVRDYSSNTDKKSRNNNHLYWAGWSVAMTGVAIDNRTYFGWGLRQGRKGLAAIQEDGTLPNELKRKGRALHYHIFATMPLTMLTWLAASNGINLQSGNPGSLERLAKLDLEGLENPGYFQQATGTKQDATRIFNASALAWLEAYNRMTPDAQAEKWLIKLRPMVQNRIGGDATLLYSTSMVK